MQKITPFLWFNDNAEEAVNFYISVFKNSKITTVSRYGEGSPFPAGTVMVMGFSVNDQEFLAMNGGPQFKFTKAISFVVNCETQEEIDWYWEKLSEGGQQIECGWLKDKFGMAWQIVPVVLGKLMSHPEKSKNVMKALLQMKKINIGKLEEAYAG